MTLTEFLLARIAEDETWVQRVDEHYAPFGREWEWCPRARTEPLGDLPGGPDAACECDCPAVKRRVLAECEAKQQIVDHCRGWVPDYEEAQHILRCLTLPYADHPDYQKEWGW